MATVTCTFKLSEEAAAALALRAQTAQQDPSEVLNDLLLGDTELDESDFTPEQWTSIQVGIAQADAGNFATPDEVEAVFARFRGSK